MYEIDVILFWWKLSVCLKPSEVNQLNELLQISVKTTVPLYTFIDCLF